MGATARILSAIFRRVPDAWVQRLAGPPTVARGQTLHPQIALLARASEGRTPVHEMSAAEARAASSKGLAMTMGPARPMAVIEHRKLPGPDGGLPARHYVPHGISGKRPLFVYFHMGGCVLGNLEWCESFCTLLAETARCPVLSVEYRKGPEHRFPAAQEDAVAAYRWARDKATELGGDPERMAVGGDSAGGGLSAHVAHALRKAGEPQPLLQLLLYPWVTAYADNASYRDLEDAFPLTPEGMRWCLANYTNDPSEYEDPRLSPLLEDDFAGLAPALVYTAGFDPLCDEGREYADALERAGVPVAYRCFEELPHSFTAMGALPAAAAALEEIALDVEGVLTGGTP